MYSRMVLQILASKGEAEETLKKKRGREERKSFLREEPSGTTEMCHDGRRTPFPAPLNGSESARFKLQVKDIKTAFIIFGYILKAYQDHHG